jgi:hypothetical protein
MLFGQGAIKLVELRSSPSGVQYLLYSLHRITHTDGIMRCKQQQAAMHTA